MKFFLSYKFTDSDKVKLKEMLELVSAEIEKGGNTSFSFFRDIQKWGTLQTEKNRIIPIALENLNISDAVLVILDANAKSTGMGIEVGYAVAKNKPIYVLKRHDVIDDYIESVAQYVGLYENICELPSLVNGLMEELL